MSAEEGPMWAECTFRVALGDITEWTDIGVDSRDPVAVRDWVSRSLEDELPHGITVTVSAVPHDRVRQRFDHGGWEAEGHLMINSPVTAVAKHVYRLNPANPYRTVGQILGAVIESTDGRWDACVVDGEDRYPGRRLDTFDDSHDAFTAIRRYLGVPRDE